MQCAIFVAVSVEELVFVCVCVMSSCNIFTRNAEFPVCKPDFHVWF